MMNRLFRWLVPKLADWCERTGRVFYITGKQGPDDVYLIRYFLFRSKYVSVYIHRFLRSDRDDPHDHPFDFIGYVVQGGYKEVLYSKYKNALGDLVLYESDQNYGAGRWSYRPCEHLHKVLVDKPRTVAEKLDAPLTFIIRGPEKRNWFFYRLGENLGHSSNFYKAEQVVWHEYLGVKPHSRE